MASAWTRQTHADAGLDTGAIYAATLESGPELVFVRATSTSTVRTANETGLPVIRMYGVSWDVLAASFNSTVFRDADGVDEAEEDSEEIAAAQERPFGDEGEEFAWASRFSAGNGMVMQWMAFIETTDISTGSFFLRTRTSGPDDTDEAWPISRTRVPARRPGLPLYQDEEGDFDFQPISYASGTGELVATDFSSGVTLSYKDPCVVHITEGDAEGWWMLLSRYRTELDASSLESGASISPDSSLGDLVAFWSPDASFRTEEVVGPFRLVACTDAILDDSGDTLSGVRVWIGTAGAEVVPAELSGEDEDCLFVYYVVERCTSLLYDEYTDLPAMDALLPTAAAGIWLRRIKLSDLAAALADPDRYTEEAAWADLPNPDPIVEGTVAGRVRIWTVVELDRYGPTDSDIETVQEVTYGISVFWADPAPKVGVYDSSPALTLFVAAIPPAATTITEPEVRGFLGAWAAAALDATTAESYGMAFGTAFTVRSTPVGIGGVDRIDGEGTWDDTLHSTTVSTLRVDPDPVLSGEEDQVIVYVGEVAEDGLSTQRELGFYAADYVEVFRDWSSAT